MKSSVAAVVGAILCGLTVIHLKTVTAAAVSEVTNVRVLSHRNAANSWINLEVHWIPGTFTGFTKYLIRVEQEILSQHSEFGSFANYTANGYSTTNCTIENVFAFRKYRVSVMAVTDGGDSEWSSPVVVRSAPNYPGQAQHFSIQQDANEAQEIKMLIICPEEEERNGTLTGYIIRKTVMTLDGTEVPQSYRVSLTPASQCHDMYSASDVGGITVGRNYSFEVMAMNTDFSGSFSERKYLFVAPRASYLAQTQKINGSEAIVRRPENFIPHPTSIEVLVCASCLLNASQGKVEQVGLLVCMITYFGQCHYGGWKNGSFTNIEDFPTWSLAKAAQFKKGYRATPDSFMHDLNDQNPDHRFTIGSDQNCDQLPNTTYCNGPLPRDSDFRIAAFKCDATGCDVSDSSDLFYTMPYTDTGSDDDSTFTIGMTTGGSVAGGSVFTCIALVYLHRKFKILVCFLSLCE